MKPRVGVGKHADCAAAFCIAGAAAFNNLKT